jgi:hypothetical protein
MIAVEPASRLDRQLQAAVADRPLLPIGDGVAMCGAQRAKHLAHPALPDPDDVGQVSGGEPLAALQPHSRQSCSMRWAAGRGAAAGIASPSAPPSCWEALSSEAASPACRVARRRWRRW